MILCSSRVYTLLDSFKIMKLNYIYTTPTDEFLDLPETKPAIKNIGWTLGNDCPYQCTHCYSLKARTKGKDMTKEMIDRIVNQLAECKIETVNLGGNEPLFTNGLKPNKTLLPYIVKELVAANMEVGLTTSGITLLYLYKNHRDVFHLLNDVDISLDSPFESEHNTNRGAKLYQQALTALDICQRHNKPHAIIMAAMNWNFTINHIEALWKIACEYDANIRINPLKPVEQKHMDIALPPNMYYDGFSRLMEICEPVDLGEPPLAAVTGFANAKRCPCGRTSFRIHSITPNGQIFVSPCVYLHDYKTPYDLLQVDLNIIINSPQFRVFRQRNANPNYIIGCENCFYQPSCGGGCAARAYLHHRNINNGIQTMRSRDPYCLKDINPKQLFPRNPKIISDSKLVHMDYLCTWIGRPIQ